MSIRVLVVDDSAFARKVVREVLQTQPDLEVVGIAHDGAEALEKIAELAPDVITLDLVMPHLDGLGVLDALTGADAPRAVVVSVSGADTERGLEALARGAIAVVQKPTALASDRLYELDRELVEQVRAAAVARPRRPAPADATAVPGQIVARRTSALVIGASTGGPPALSRILAAMPATMPVPIFVVVHLPSEYTDSFARRLDTTCALHVRQAFDGLRPAAGDVVIARGGSHLVLRRDTAGPVVRLDGVDARHAHRPAVDVLFASAAAVYGDGALGVVLTGMGTDGADGARAIVDAGGRELTESEASCVVYGMPRAVVEAGLSSGEARIEDMVALILDQL